MCLEKKIAAPGLPAEGGIKSNEAKASTTISTPSECLSRTISPEQLAENDDGNRRFLATGFIHKSHMVTSVMIDGRLEVRMQCLNTGEEYPIFFYQGMSLVCLKCFQSFTIDFREIGLEVA